MALAEDRYSAILGEDFATAFMQPRQFFWHARVNTLKISAEKMIKKFEEKGYSIEQIPWMREGFWIDTKESLSRTMEHVLGYFFLQNSSSMVSPLVLEPKPMDKILDLCASPGAKTTQIAAMMENTGVIVANDIRHERLKALRGNLQRCGVMNVVVTRSFGENFWKTGLKFKKILLDAPCSGTGSLNPRILKETSLSSVKMLSRLQKRLLDSASRCLEEDGVLVYSTCSLEPEENEENIDFAVRNLGLSTEEIKISNLPIKNALAEWDGKKYDDSVSNSIRIMPGSKTEGFFICKLRR